MWARVPETEGVSCGLGDSVADRMCRDPSLRGLPPEDLARQLGVSLGQAQAGILRLAERATGRKVTGARGQSLDGVLGARGRSGPKVAIEYAPDAQGGFATAAKPTVLPPGATDPRTRSFTKAILDPNLVAEYGEAAVKQAGLAGLVPPPEDLDRVALFAPPPISGEWSAFTWLDTFDKYGALPDGSTPEPTWSDVQTAGSAIGRPDLDALAVRSSLAWWRQAYALGPLPEDEQGTDDPRSSSWNWPTSSGGNFIRRIYFWGFGKDGKLYKHMQVQKADNFGNWKIFNQNGQDLTFVWNGSQWIAGWDFGDWFTQNKRAIVSTAQLAVTAVLACIPFAGAAVGAIAGTLFGVAQFGFSLGVTTAIAGAVAAQQSFIIAMQAIATGDLGTGFKYFAAMAQDLGGVPIVGDSKLIPPAFNDFVNSAPIQALAKVVGGAGTGDLGALVTKAAALGASTVKIGQAEIGEARKLVPDELRPWFDRAVKEGGAAVSRQVPWYAQGTHALGVVMGTLQNPESAGVRAPKVIRRIDDSGYSLEELQAELSAAKANYDQVAATFYGQTHPDFLAQYQQNIAALEVRIQVKKTPGAIVQQPGTFMSFAQYAAAHPVTSPAKTQAPASLASPVPIAVGGGLLALLFFL